MTRLNIIVEGQTEETFVRDVLAPKLGELGVYASARCIETGRRDGRIFRGGMTGYARAKRDIRRWLDQESAAFVTTMFDYYALPTDFPRPPKPRARESAADWAAQVEAALSADVADRRFIPYIQMHEFEALLFADAGATGRALRATAPQLSQLHKLAADFATPEDIDEGHATAPSRRLQGIFDRYDKPFFGSLAIQAADFSVVRARCVHFGSWVSRLEALADKG